MEGLFYLGFLAFLLFPFLQQYSRTKSFKISEYKKAQEKSLRNLVIFLIYAILLLIWPSLWQSGEKEFALWLYGVSILTAGFCVLLLLSNEKFLSSKKESPLVKHEFTRFYFYLVLLIPTVVGILFVLFILWTEISKAKRFSLIQTRWSTERAEFLKKYKKASSRLEKQRSAVKSQEVRVSEFLEANPSAVLFRAPKDAREFELICANWMQLWGEVDAKATQFSGDGGIDVVSSNFAAQVKFYANSPVGRPEVQALYGAASGHGLQPAFFAYSNGYTNEALEWGKMMGIACFTFNFVLERNRFEFEANTEQAAELALREEGWSYLDWQEWTELEETFKTFQQEPPAYAPPSWLRKKDAVVASQTTTVEISVE